MKGKTKQTEKQLLELSGCSRLQDIIELDLTDCGIESLDTQVFNKLTSLRSLYLSCNKIRRIPDDLELDCLQVLDLSSNDLQSVDGLENFPVLRELCIDGNKKISPDDSYIAMVLCPLLQSIDGGTDLDIFHSGIQIYEEQLVDPLRSVWDAKFAEVYDDGVPEEEIDVLHAEFVRTVQTAGIIGTNLTMAKFRKFMIHRLAYQLICGVNSDTRVGENTRKGKRTSVSAADANAKYSTRTSRGSRPSMDSSSGTPVEREQKRTPRRKEPVETPSRKRKRSESSPETPTTTHHISKKRRDATPATPKYGSSSKSTPQQSDTSKSTVKHASASKPTPKLKDSAKITPKQKASSKITPKDTSRSTSKHKNTSNSSKTTPKETAKSKSTPKSSNLSSNKTKNADSSSKKSKKNTPKTPASKGKRKVEAPLDFTELKERLQSEERTLLGDVDDYDPSFFLRCHSDDNDPTDNLTKIWKCAFEPKIGGKKGETTSTLATCGGNIVCFIDCQTGKVMRRYKDSSDTESFYTLAWTTLTINDKDVNILAVAGQDGEIKLIHPTQLVMFGVVGRHRCYINALLFHPDQPNILFSSAMDNKVFIWDIGVPDLKVHSISAVKKATLSLPKRDAVTLVYSPSLDVLVAGCDNSCYAWDIGDIGANAPIDVLVAGCDNSCYAWDIGDIGTNVPSPHYEFVHPVEDSENGNNSETIDGLVLLSNNCIVSKCVGHSCLYLWDLRLHLSARSGGVERVPVRPLALLEYTPVTVDYIYPCARSNHLMVGDDHGRVHMYDLSRVVKKKKPSDEILTSSRVLEYPYINVAKTSRKMSDVATTQDVVVNCIATSSDRQFLVYGTDNNLVCVWNNANKL